MQKVVILIIALIFNAEYLFSQKVMDLEQFIGTWALTLPHNGFNDAGWLEIKQAEGHICSSLLWYGGSVTPWDHAYISGESLIVTKSQNRKTANGQSLSVTSRVKLHVEGDRLFGIRMNPQVDGSGVQHFEFFGKRLPADPPPPNHSSLKFGEPISLLKNNDLDGWSIIGNNENGWSVSNGILINDPVQNGDEHIHYGNLRTDEEFEDFNLKLEVNVPEGNNSGVYLRGIYEIQVVDSYGKSLDSHNMGALYSRIVPSQAAEKPAGEWQSMDITLVDRHVTVILNGQKIIDNQPVRGITGGALTANEFKPGPLYLQGDHGKVMYRNIVLTPILK